jgi:hypothetical protein
MRGLLLALSGRTLAQPTESLNTADEFLFSSAKDCLRLANLEVPGPGCHLKQPVIN